MNLTYETSGGYKRTVKNVGKGVISENKTHITFHAENGRTYHWFADFAIDGRIVGEVLTIETKRNWCRVMGTKCRYQKTS